MLYLLPSGLVPMTSTFPPRLMIACLSLFLRYVFTWSAMYPLAMAPQIDAGFGIFQCNGVILNVDLCVINVAYGLGNGIGKMEPLVYLP